MNDNVRCVDCFYFGYFRVEHARSGGTTYFHPETLPADVRRLLLENHEQPFKDRIALLLARDHRVACLAEVTDSTGRRRAVEPTFDSVNAQTGFSRIRDTAVCRRKCQHFNAFDPLLSFSDVLALHEKNRTDAIARRISERRRTELHSQLRSLLETLDSDKALTPQQRGRGFERWFGSLFNGSDVRYTLDVRNNWEQLDFTVWLGNLFCIGEARWLSDPVDTKQVRDFFGKLLDRPPFVVGLIISVSGFTGPALKWAAKHTHDRTIIPLDRGHLIQSISGSQTFTEFVLNQLNERLNHPAT